MMSSIVQLNLYLFSCWRVRCDLIVLTLGADVGKGGAHTREMSTSLLPHRQEVEW